MTRICISTGIAAALLAMSAMFLGAAIAMMFLSPGFVW